MPNVAKLNSWIEAKGLKKSFVASRIGISQSSLSKKIKGKRAFSINEISAFKQLGMTQREINEIFLT